MSHATVRIVLIGIALSAVIAGVILAATGPGERSHTRASARGSAVAAADIEAAARYLGFKPAKLRSELRQGETLAAIAQSTGGRSVDGLAAALAAAKTARVRAAAKAGELSETAADAQLATVTARARAEVRRHRRPIVGLGSSLAPAARYLRMSPGELLSQVRGGRSLKAIATQRAGRSAAGLLDALVAARSARIAQAVKQGALSRGEAAELRATLRRRMSLLVDRGSTQR